VCIRIFLNQSKILAIADLMGCLGLAVYLGLIGTGAPREKPPPALPYVSSLRAR